MKKLSNYIIFGALIIYLGSITALARDKLIKEHNEQKITNETSFQETLSEE